MITEQMKRIIRHAVRKIPENKPYFEAIAAILSIPVLITVILLNLNNLNQKNAKVGVSPTPAPQQVIIRNVPITLPAGQNTTAAPTANPSVCNKSIGPISISSPQENQTVSNSPVCITIQHDSNYCSVVWSYQINGGGYSDFSSNSPCLYNIPNGNVRFDLRVQSTVSQDTTTLTRNFNYQGNSISPTPNPSPTGTK